jgi:hypothetical protein
MCFRHLNEKIVLPKVADEIKKTQQPSKNTAKDFVSGGGTGTPTSTGSSNSQVKVGASTSNSSRTANTGLTRLRIPRSTT